MKNTHSSRSFVPPVANYDFPAAYIEKHPAAVAYSLGERMDPKMPQGGGGALPNEPVAQMNYARHTATARLSFFFKDIEC